jgi:hypothetical protein
MFRLFDSHSGPSLNLLLSIMKEDSFVCRDAHIRTRDLEYRNQTWSVRVFSCFRGLRANARITKV